MNALAAPASMTNNAGLRQVATVTDMLKNKHAFGQLSAVAASHLNPERMMRTLALSVAKTPKLGECTPLSLLGALMTCASMGLEPNTAMGHAYLIPFENRRAKAVEAQLVIGYRGYIQLAWNSGQVASIDAAIHYADDPIWKWRRGSNAILEHEQGDMLEEILHAYAVFETKAGGKTWIVWPEAKLVAHRDRYSKGYAFDIQRGKKPTDANVNIWLADPALARMKTMIRQLAKMMPMSSEAPQAAALDGARANYAAFAMDPSMGLPSPEEADDAELHDGDEVIDSGPAQVEDKTPAPIQTATTTAGPDPVAEARRKAAAAATAQRQREAAERQAAKGAPPSRDEPSTRTGTGKAAAPAQEPAAVADDASAEVATEPEAEFSLATGEDGADWQALDRSIRASVVARPASEAFEALADWEEQLAPYGEADPTAHAALMDWVVARDATDKAAGEE